MLSLKVIKSDNLTLEDISELIPAAGPVPDFRAQSRLREWIGEVLLARDLIGKPCRIFHKENGAPYVDIPGVNISISHTKGYVAMLVADHIAGLDIESISPRAIKVADKFISESEKNIIGQVDETKAVAIWTVKEAVFKASSLSPVDFKNDISITGFDSESCDVTVSKEMKTEHFHVSLQYLQDYVQSIAEPIQ